MARAEFTVGMDDNVIRNLALSAAVQAIGPRSISMVEVQTSEILKMAGEFEKFLRGPSEVAKEAIPLPLTEQDWSKKKFTADEVRRDFARALGRCASCGSTVPEVHNVRNDDRACSDNFHDKAVATCGGCGEPKNQGDHGPGVCV